MICPYCGALAKLQDSAVIYGTSYGQVYLCTRYPKCDAFVGVHKGTNKPLGTMANKPLRELRKQCHRRFDVMWKKQKFTRKAAYQWLSMAMKISKGKAHIGRFNEEQCKGLLAILRTGNV